MSNGMINGLKTNTFDLDKPNKNNIEISYKKDRLNRLLWDVADKGVALDFLDNMSPETMTYDNIINNLYGHDDYITSSVIMMIHDGILIKDNGSRIVSTILRKPVTYSVSPHWKPVINMLAQNEKSNQ